MSTTAPVTAAIAAAALAVGGLAGAALTPAPAPTAADASSAIAVLEQFVAAHPDITPTSSPSPTDIPTTAGPTSTPTPVVTSSTPSPNITTPAPSGSIGTLAFKPPTLTTPTTITVVDGQGKITLATGKDYVIKLPTDRAWKNTRGLWVEGGRNVVVIGGQVDVGAGYFSGGPGPGVQPNGYVRRAAYFLSQTGTIHLEGVRFTSSTGALSEGINMSAALARVQLLNIAIGTPLVGSKDANHADCLQSWNGPVSLKVDGFSCTTGYQGMFLNPHDTSSTSVVANDWELRNVEIVGTAAAKYILWLTPPPASVKTVNVYTSGGLGNWNAATAWPNVTKGRAPAPFAIAAGLGYVSPGYA